jgi:hypothetical protein
MAPCIATEPSDWIVGDMTRGLPIFPSRDGEAAAAHKFASEDERGLRSVQNVTLPNKLVGVIHILRPERS